MLEKISIKDEGVKILPNSQILW